MIRTQFVARGVAVLALAVGASMSTAAYALPLPGMHHHPSDKTPDPRVDLFLHNKGQIFCDVKIADHVYTVLPHQSIEVKAPAGTPIYTNSTGAMHHKGDLLFSIDPKMQKQTLEIN